MESQHPKPRLIVIPGGRSEESPVGPITRLGLWHRFPQPSKAQVTMILAAKLLLLAAAIALVFH